MASSSTSPRTLITGGWQGSHQDISEESRNDEVLGEGASREDAGRSGPGSTAHTSGIAAKGMESDDMSDSGGPGRGFLDITLMEKSKEETDSWLTEEKEKMASRGPRSVRARRGV
jgi:hypothetical protein